MTHIGDPNDIRAYGALTPGLITIEAHDGDYTAEQDYSIEGVKNIIDRLQQAIIEAQPLALEKLLSERAELEAKIKALDVQINGGSCNA